MARPPRYVRAFYDVASGDLLTADERPGAAPAPPRRFGRRRRVRRHRRARDGGIAGSIARGLIKYRGPRPTRGPRSTTPVGASCFFDDVAGVAERRHLALDGGMERRGGASGWRGALREGA